MAVAWTIVILLIALWPSQPTDGGWVDDALAWLHERGLPAWIGYDTIEFAANVVLFVPFGLLLALALTDGRRLRSADHGRLSGTGSRRLRSAEGASRNRARDSVLPVLLWPTVLGLALSLAVEFVQAAFLPARFPSASDLAANASGGLIGALLALPLRRSPRAPA